MLLESPIEVVWSFTSKCNLQCPFCLVSSGKDKKDSTEDTGKLRILKEIIDNRVLKVVLTGGEPLTDNLTYHIISSLRKAGISVELTTNGTLLNRKTLNWLKCCGLKNIQISIHGSTPGINDMLTGEKSFRKIVNAIELSLISGIPIHTKTTLTKHNISDAPSLVKLLSSLGVTSICLDEVVPIGRALNNYSSLKPSVDELLKLESMIEELEINYSVEIDFKSFSLSMRQDGCAATCTLGDEKSYLSTISEQGNMYQCSMSALFDVRNNVLEKGLKKCWQDIRAFRKFIKPEKLTGACGSCELKEKCRGGCRGIAYRMTSSLWGEYPLCPLAQRGKFTSDNNTCFFKENKYEETRIP